MIKHKDDWAGDVDITTFAPKSVKSEGDFEDILARGKPDIWTSNRPAKGGETGAMFEKIIARALEMRGNESKESKVTKESKVPKTRRPAAIVTAKKKPAKRRSK